MNLDLLLKKALKQDKKVRDKYLALLSVLPAISMLKKLLNRKQQGKKPFSDEFNYSEKHDKILAYEADFAAWVEQSNLVSEEAVKHLHELAEITDLACTEIRLASLKGDYQWISATFRDAAKLI